MVDVLLILHKVLVEILASVVVGSMVNDLFAQTFLQRLHRLLSCLVVVKVGMNLVVLAQQVRWLPQVDDAVQYQIVFLRYITIDGDRWKEVKEAFKHIALPVGLIPRLDKGRPFGCHASLKELVAHLIAAFVVGEADGEIPLVAEVIV